MTRPADSDLAARGYGLPTLVALVVAGMIGSGVFTTSGFAVEAVGSRSLVLAAWVVAGGIAVCGAVGYAALAAAIPVSGGEYLYLARRFHPFAGFLAGWVSLTAGFSGSIALAALACESYATPLLGLPASVPPRAVASLIVIGCGLAHAFTSPAAAAFTTLVTLVKMVAIGGFILLGYATLGGHTVEPAAAAVPFSLGSFASTVMWISFSYAGFNQAVYIASEAREPRRTVPQALLIGTLVTTLAYLPLNDLFLRAGPLAAIAGQADVAAIAAAELGGPWLETWMRGIIALATLSSVAGMMMAGPRVYARMADDGLFPEFFTGSRGMGRAVLLQMVVALGLVHLASIRELLGFLGVTLALFSALAVATLWLPGPDRAEPASLSRPAAAAAAIYVVATLMFVVLMTLHDPRHLAGTAVTVISGAGLWKVGQYSACRQAGK
jgi:amino acid transporter